MAEVAAVTAMRHHYLGVLQALPVDIYSEALARTPERAAKAMAEMTGGYQVDVPGLFTTFDDGGYDELVALRDIEFASLCEHHLLPFSGVAHVAYLPDNRIVGLSKLARVVDAYARRLQTQELLTVQVADAIMGHLNPRGVAVVVEATHLCMALRGVRKAGATMTTSCLRGTLANPAARAETMALLLR